MDIKQQALEAARPFANSVEELIEQASFIEAYLKGKKTTSPSEPETLLERTESKSQYRSTTEYLVLSHDGKVAGYLRPSQLDIGQYMKESDVILNVSRQWGTTTLIAAFASQEQSLGKRVLILTNNFHNSNTIQQRLDDKGVDVMTFDRAIESLSGIAPYHYIIIDNAAYIPYGKEAELIKTIESLRTPETKLTLASVPGLDTGWFYEAWASEHIDSVRKITVNWKSSDMTIEQAQKLRQNIGDDSFENQYENKFRKAEDPLFSV